MNLLSLKTINSRLEDSYKELEVENATLLNEKVELMKSNDYLMGINQKLISNMTHNVKEFHPQQFPMAN